MQGQLKKMHTRLDSPVQYDLPLGDQTHRLESTDRQANQADVYRSYFLCTLQQID